MSTFNYDGALDMPKGGDFPVVTICGSMRNYPFMLAAAAEFTGKGFIVIMPHVITRPGEPTALKTMLDDMHRSKIARSDAILVVGTPGRSTLREIDYADELKVRVWNYSVPS